MINLNSFLNPSFRVTPFLRLLPAIVLVLVFATCSDNPQNHSGHGPESRIVLEGEGPFKVVVTVGMLADSVQAIMGDTAEMTVLMGPGTDPHLYTPSRDDVVALQRADLIVYSGHHLEGRMVDQLHSLARKKPVIAGAELLPDDVLVTTSGGQVDPHIWTNVDLWSRVTTLVAEELANSVPSHADAYRTSGAAYAAKLDRLHEYGKILSATVPEDGRVLISAHDAFEYFGKAYGYEVLAIQGISTEAEAGLGDINQLVDEIVTRKIPSVFFESSVPKKSVEALIEGARARGHNVRNGGELYSDAMGKAGSYEGTYVGMMDHNLSTIAHELGGDVPAVVSEQNWNGE